VVVPFGLPKGETLDVRWERLHFDALGASPDEDRQYVHAVLEGLADFAANPVACFE
jgi:hypothetical protein